MALTTILIWPSTGIYGKKDTLSSRYATKSNLEIAQPDDDENKVFRKYRYDWGRTWPGDSRRLWAACNMQNVFHRGQRSVRFDGETWVPLPPVAAGVIHTDFERGFIRAEVIAFDDFIEYNGERRGSGPVNPPWR